MLNSNVETINVHNSNVETTIELQDNNMRTTIELPNKPDNKSSAVARNSTQDQVRTTPISEPQDIAIEHETTKL